MEQTVTNHGSPAASGFPADRVLHDWRGAYGRAVLYLEALGVEADRRPRLALRAVEAAFRAPAWEGGDAFAGTMKELRRLVMELYPAGPPASGDPEERFEAWRLEAALAGRAPRDIPAAGADPIRESRVRATPPLSRKSMAATKFERGPRRGVRARRRKTEWSGAARRRRLLLPPGTR